MPDAFRRQALLLLGPTGSGKTPLGQLLQQRGLNTARCLHFDFGQHLRAAATETDYSLSPEQGYTIRTLLATNALLPDDQLPIAAAILTHVLTASSLGPQDWLVLNGLPRHLQQAIALDRFVDIRAVVVLKCAPQVVCQRIATNAGGDRATRTDDSAQDIARKLDIFRGQTQPLIDHYRARGAAVIDVPVTVSSSAADAHDILQQHFD